MTKPAAADRVNHQPGRHRLRHCPAAAAAASRTTLQPAADGAGVAGADPFAHQSDHPGVGGAVTHQPIRGGPDHRRHPDPVARPNDHRDQQELPAQRQHPLVICARQRRVVTVAQYWPGNRNDVVVARQTVAHILTGHHEILGDAGYRGIDTITSPARDKTDRIIRDDHYRTHPRIRTRVEHDIARPKDRHILRQCRRRGEAINHSLQITPDSGTSRSTNHYGSTLSASPSPR